MTSMTEIADRLEIADVLARYAYAVDSGDLDRLDSVFTEDALIDYTSAGGVRGPREEVKAWLADVLRHWPGRLHLIGAMSIRFEGGDEAVVAASFADTLSPSREAVAADTSGVIQGGGWYHHRMVRTPSGWRSRELVEEQTWRTMR
ncbi:nuclear transport factor 2 family protein [Sphaerisporangium viridialbum]|uniref:nuclear transport factor 2 family protein n=1 Tax=Sphaerisporangium viridialbum TaxID=46189 RepID=UPI003C7383ED